MFAHIQYSLRLGVKSAFNAKNAKEQLYFAREEGMGLWHFDGSWVEARLGSE